MKFLKNYWIYTLVILPSLTEWVDDAHFPTRLKEATTDIVMTLVMGLMIWIFVKEKEKVEQLSIMDKLTEIYNSRHLRTELDRLVTLAHRTFTPLSMIFIDLDNFKPVNDTYGHSAGDKILRQFAKSLLESTRKDVDICFRQGGDEFVVLCQQTRSAIAKQIAERIFDQSRLIEDLKEKQVTLSLGVTELKANETPYEFLKRTDQSMYAAKKSGKNRCHYEENTGII